MEYKFKLVIPEKKAQRIFDAMNCFVCDDKLSLKDGEKIEFPINLKDGKKLVLKLEGQVDDWSDDADPDKIDAWVRIQLFDTDGNIIARDGLLTRNFFTEWKLTHNEETYIINATFDGSLSGAEMYDYVKNVKKYDWLH